MPDAMTIRKQMAAEGWQSNDRFTWMGWGAPTEPYGYSIWFERWEWHGKRCDKGIFGSMTRNLANLDACVAEAAAKARHAYAAFPNYPPEVLADGTMRENSIARTAIGNEAFYRIGPYESGSEDGR